ncbi:DUF7221 family queuine tRNA-ribosyltransferase-like protein [Embleya sp. MST-111070]|uniref:deazapurine DNA modification protein DpdA family protein n=1 Tax=Embleya sp. MST-111070 TaxID=3398231 RepID=UPI003F73F33B
MGVHQPAWLTRISEPLFVSHRRLENRRSLPRAVGPWALDSGAFSELGKHGEWRTSATRYAAAVDRYADEIGKLQWCSPMDWMCEPETTNRTGKSVQEHLRRTVDSVLELRSLVGKARVIPVLQGWLPHQYVRCAEMYADAGIDLFAEPLVGVGSMCQRQNHVWASLILENLARLGGPGAPPMDLHAFGFKTQGLLLSSSWIASADSMAWSTAGRHERGCSPTHRSESNCILYATRWRNRLAERLEDAGVQTV